jgi:hypothetical protein
MDPQDLQSSPKPFTRATIDDKTGLLGSTTSSTSAAKFGPSGGAGVTNAYAGAEVTKKTAGNRITSRSLTVTTASHAGSYKIGAGNPLTLTGTTKGVAGVTETLLLTAVNGNETIRGATLWDDPTLVTVDVPGQNDALGAFSVGVGDIGGPLGASIRGFKVHADGSVVTKGQDGFIDTAVMVANAVEPSNLERVVASGTSAVGITVYA